MTRDDGTLSDAQEAEYARELERRKAQNGAGVKTNGSALWARSEAGEIIDAVPRAPPSAVLDDLFAVLRQAAGKKSYGVVLAIVRAYYGHRLAYNEMAEADELDGRPFRDADYGRIADEIEARHGIDAGIEKLHLAVTQLCDERRYHPARSYLESRPAWDGVSRWRLIPTKVFGHTPIEIPEAPSLAEVALERFAISAVARALCPGCQVDTVLILQGEQGFKKTTFFRVLAGAWHGEGAMDIHNNKAPLLLGASWIWVWDELTTAMRGREEVAVKDFITRRKDVFVKPYGRHAITKLRSCVIGGTTNATEILTDPTGDRRYWIVEVFKRIETEWLEENRDQLWAEALALYQRKIQWHLTDEEEAQRSEEAAAWRAPEAWLEPVSIWVDSMDARRLLLSNGWLTTNDIAAGLGVPVERRDKGVMTRIGLAMKQLAWEEQRRTVGAAKVREYRPRPQTT